MCTVFIIKKQKEKKDPKCFEQFQEKYLKRNQKWRHWADVISYVMRAYNVCIMATNNNENNGNLNDFNNQNAFKCRFSKEFVLCLLEYSIVFENESTDTVCVSNVNDNKFVCYFKFFSFLSFFFCFFFCVSFYV